MRLFVASILMSSLFLATACKKKEGDAGNAGATGGATQPAVPPAKLTWKKLGSMPLEAEIPEGAEVTDNTAGAGFASATIYASPTTFVSGEGGGVKPTIEEAKAALEKDPGNKHKAWTKEEKTADGWILENTRESMTGGELLGISVRRTIEGKAYDCGTNSRSADEREKAKKLCLSLRAAK